MSSEPGDPDVDTLVDQIVELLLTGGEETGWNEDIARAWAERMALKRPDLSQAFIELDPEDQNAVIDHVLKELAARRPPLS